MIKHDIAEKISIPSIRGFSEDTLQKEAQYIIIGNFNYVYTEPKGFITDDESMVFKESGLSNEVFFEVMWDFAMRHGKKVVMFEEESFVITGGSNTLDCLNIECGNRFCYLPSSAEEISDFCAHEKALMLANAAGHNDQNSICDDVQSHLADRLDS